MKATKNFFDEIIQCLIVRREEWDLQGNTLVHKSGVMVIRDGGGYCFEPAVDLSEEERERLREVAIDIARQHVLERLGVTSISDEERMDHRHLARINGTFFSNILHSVRSDPDSWTLGRHTLSHTSGIELWAANGVNSRRIYTPSMELENHEKPLLEEAIQQHKRYSILKRINEDLPVVEASAKTWGERCPYCLDYPEKECYRCECDVLLHQSCAEESEKCPVCRTDLQLSKPEPEQEHLPTPLAVSPPNGWDNDAVSFFGAIAAVTVVGHLLLKLL